MVGMISWLVGLLQRGIRFIVLETKLVLGKNLVRLSIGPTTRPCKER